MQVVALGILAAGCSTTKPAGLAPENQSTSKPASIPVPPPPPLTTGTSRNNTEEFVDASGNLKPDLLAYARDVSNTRDVPLQQVDAILRDAQYNPTVARLVTPRHTHIRRSWVTYRKRFVEPIRIKTGVRFWSEQKPILDKIAAEYGVPQSIIVEIGRASCRDRVCQYV